jgi:tetratricopeptide (TPR) repeat protein
VSGTFDYSGDPSTPPNDFGPAPRKSTAKWKIIIFVAGLATAAAALLLRPVIRDFAASRNEVTLQAAQHALDSGDVSHAIELAQSALIKAKKSRRSTAPCQMLLGLAREQQGERGSPGDRLVYYAAAVQHFVEASKDNLSPEDAARLQFHLAKCQHARGQYSDSIPMLEQSLSTYPAGRAESHQLLAIAYLEPTHLDLDLAHQHNLHFMETPGLSKEQLAHAWENRRDLLARLGRSDPLSDIDFLEVSTDTKWVSSLVSACELFQNKQFDAASACLHSLVKIKGLPQPVERRAWYLIALAAKENGDADTALAVFRQQIEWRYPHSHEARAAATQAGAVLLAQGKLDVAITELSRAAQMAVASGDNHPLPLGGPSLGRVMGLAIDRLREQEQFDSAIELLESYRQIVSGATADRASAELHQAWAAAMWQRAKTETSIDSAQTQYRAEELSRTAATYWVRVADAAESPEDASSVLWQAANDFMRGNGHLLAVGTLERLLSNSAKGAMRVEALALFCAALEQCGRPDAVPDVAETCIREFPNHPATCLARYHWARCQIGFGEIDQAEANLRSALASATSEVDPDVLQNIRLVLAHILHDQGREEEAIRPLNEIIAEPRDFDSSIEARLLLSDCLRQRARRPAGRLVESRSPSAQSHYRQRKDEDFEQALEILGTAQRELAALERSSQLATHQAEWLRECRRGIADCLFESDRADDAIEMYKNLAETYTAPGDWLDAQLQIAHFHVRMNRLESARTVLRAAQLRLRQTPEAIEQARVGMSPERWKEWVEWVRQL